MTSDLWWESGYWPQMTLASYRLVMNNISINLFNDSILIRDSFCLFQNCFCQFDLIILNSRFVPFWNRTFLNNLDRTWERVMLTGPSVRTTTYRIHNHSFVIDKQNLERLDERGKLTGGKEFQKYRVMIRHKVKIHAINAWSNMKDCPDMHWMAILQSTATVGAP